MIPVKNKTYVKIDESMIYAGEIILLLLYW